MAAAPRAAQRERESGSGRLRKGCRSLNISQNSRGRYYKTSRRGLVTGFLSFQRRPRPYRPRAPAGGNTHDLNKQQRGMAEAALAAAARAAQAAAAAAARWAHVSTSFVCKCLWAS